MVEYIEILGKEYPVRVGYYVMKKVKEETGYSLGEAMQKAQDDMSIHETILFAALQMGAFAEKQELDLSKEDAPMILDACFMDYLKIFSSDKFFPKDEIDKMEKEMDSRLGKDQTGKKSSSKKTKKEMKRT